MKILLTGGTGFLGRRVAAHLAREHAVRLLVRPGPARGGLGDGYELAAGDVTDRDSLLAAMAGCDAVVHAAALVKIVAPAAEFDRINVGGLENVLAAAERAGVGRLLYVSSFIALGPSEQGAGGLLDETAEPLRAGRRWINDYERTKSLADAAARAAVARGAPLGVVYPAVIYGPGELTEGNIVVRHILDLAHGRLPALLGRPQRRWSYAFVEDVAEGIARAVARGERGGRYVLGGDNVTSAEFYRAVAELGGIRVPGARMPDALATLSGALMKLAARVSGGTPRLTPDLVEIYRHDWAYDSSRAMRELGYAPRPLAAGLAETFAWLRTTAEWPAR
ncbi:MAG: NAD-dependent epimerase/dehydratase family protein [Thermoanaerobaculia bacterium]|nr:NAD-dependent epimerase/dehydratase family protein [Thermoanaerobaculia bacterium]